MLKAHFNKASLSQAVKVGGESHKQTKILYTQSPFTATFQNHNAEN